ncbi:MAG: MFS transporter, partial [Bacilli bacterium]
PMAFQIAFLITAVWWIAFSFPMFRNVHQVYEIEKESAPLKNTFARLQDAVKYAFKNRTLALFLIGYFFYIDGVGTVIKMATVFGEDLGVGATDLIIVLFAIQVVAFPCAVIFGMLAKRFGAKNMLIVGVIIYSIIAIYGAFFMNSTLDFWILAMLVASSQGGIQALSRSFFARMIPAERSNEMFGFFNIFGKFAAIMGPTLVAIITKWTNEPSYGILSLLALFVIGLIFLVQVKEEGIALENDASISTKM